MSASDHSAPDARARARCVTASAPGSVGNVAVGFDLLGHSIAGPRDRVVATRVAEPGARIERIDGVVRDLPHDADRNTASVAVAHLLRAAGAGFGVSLAIEKGIPLGSGLGGSAASAVAAVVAANALLDTPLTADALYAAALAGEAVASGSAHGDNVAPQLLGGLVLAGRNRRVRLDVPSAWHAVVVHPAAILETRRARAALAGAYALGEFVAQAERLALVLIGCARGDASLVREGLEDVLVEPRRAALIPGFAAVKSAALAHDALGASISGAGPSVFAWFESRVLAERASTAMIDGFASAGLGARAYVSPISGPRAEVESCTS